MFENYMLLANDTDMYVHGPMGDIVQNMLQFCHMFVFPMRIELL